MIRWERSAEVKKNKGWQWAKEVTAYINEICPEEELKVFTLRFGRMNVVSWMADVDDLAALDAYQEKVGADAGYQELLAKSKGMFGNGKDIVKSSL